MRTIKCCPVVFGVTLTGYCHNHFVVVSCQKQTLPLSVNNLPRFVAAECIALGSRIVHSTRWSQILAENRLPTCIRRPCRYPSVKKIEDNFICFDMYERDRRTDRQTPHNSTGRAYALHCIARQKSYCRAMLYQRGLSRHAVSVCPSVCSSITFVNSVETNKHIFKIFSPSGSHTILVFPYQTSWQYQRPVFC